MTVHSIIFDNPPSPETLVSNKIIFIVEITLGFLRGSHSFFFYSSEGIAYKIGEKICENFKNGFILFGLGQSKRNKVFHPTG